MTGLREALRAYGADYDETLSRFMGNEALYLKCLAMLARDENLEKLGAALRDEDMTAAFEAAHTLKGVAGNLGLTPLYEAVCGLVEPLRAGQLQGLDAAYRALCAQFERVNALREAVI